MEKEKNNLMEIEEEIFSPKYADKITIEEISLQWKIYPRYIIRDILGAGAYSLVVEAIDTKTNKQVAIKKVSNLFASSIDCKRVLREITLLRQLDHPNIIKLYNVFFEEDNDNFNSIYIVLEFCQSDLHKVIQMSKDLNQKHLKKISYQLFKGIHYLHSVGVLHRDLKPANVLINEDLSLKITDFGLARSLGDPISIYPAVNSPRRNYPPPKELMIDLLKKQNKKPELTKHITTRWYRAPEIILIEKTYDDKIDIWSAGCIFAELQNVVNYRREDRRPLFPGQFCYPLTPKMEDEESSEYDSIDEVKQLSKNRKDQLNVIISILGTPGLKDISFITDENALNYVKNFKNFPAKNLRDLYPKSNENAIDLIEQMIKFNPKERIGIENVLQNNYFKDIRAKRPVKLEKSKLIPPVCTFDLDEKLTTEKMRKLFIEERNYYKNMDINN